MQDLTEIREQILRVKDVDAVPMVLVGNKCDLEDDRMVETDQGEDQSKTWTCSFMECSAKTRVNVDKIFKDVVMQINKSMPKDKKGGKKGGCTIL